MRKMKWKRIAAMLVAVVMLCGAVGDWSFLVKAANTDISISWNGYWEAFVYDTSGASKPDAAMQYCFDSIVVDDVEVKGTVLADLTLNAQFAIWDSYWYGTLKPTKSVLIKAGTQLQEFDASTWAVKEDGQTYTITNTLYVTSSDGGKTWNVTEYVEDTANKITLGFEAKYTEEWYFTVTNLPSDAATYYIADKVTIDGTESNSVKFTVSNGKILIEEWFFESNKPTKSIVIPKDMTLREFSTDPWGAVSGGKTMVTANELKVVYDGTTWKVENPVVADDVALRFVVVSDAHMETADDARGERIAQMFERAYEYARQDETHSTLDAVVFNGDIVNHGTAAEYDAFKEVIDRAIHAEETELLTTMGNHEYWDQNVNDVEVDSAQLYQNGINDIDSIQQKELNWSTTINGYSFIGMSPQVSEGSWDTYGETTLNWMSEKVEEAVAADEEKPVFTFQHFAIGDTVYGTANGTGAPTGESDKLNAVYEGHNQVINFSGHTHAPINGPTSINQTTYTQYTTGTLYYLNMDASASYGAQPSGTDQTNEYTIVEVYKDNTVKMFPYDGKEGQFFKKLDGFGEQLVFEVDVNDSTHWLYTSAREEKEVAPVFASDAEITTDETTYKSATITFPQATDESGVYAYDITCTPDTGEAKTYRIFSEWYFFNMPETLTYTMAGLTAETAYKVSVVPVDFFGKEGTAITTAVTTTSADDARFSLSLADYQAKDSLFQLVPSNMDYVGGTNYKIPVTVDGTTETYIVASKQASGYLAVWLPSYLQVYKKDLTVTSSIEIKSGAVLQEVSSSNWEVIEGGDSIIVTDGVLLIKDAEGLYQQQKSNKTVLSRDNTSPWEQTTYLQLLLESSFNTIVTTYGWGDFKSTILIDGKESPVTWAVNGEGSIMTKDCTNTIPTSATSIVIPAGTVLTRASGVLVIKEEYALYKVNGTWMECKETTLSKNNTSPWEQTTYLQLLLESSFNTIFTTYGWGNFKSTILIDGVETPVTWAVNGEDNIVTKDCTNTIPTSATSIVIPAGTVLTHDTSTEEPLIVTKELSLVKLADGNWYNEADIENVTYDALQSDTQFTAKEAWNHASNWYTGSIYVDGVKKEYAGIYMTKDLTWVTLGNGLATALNNHSTILIPNGTLFTCSGATPFRFCAEEDIQLVWSEVQEKYIVFSGIVIEAEYTVSQTVSGSTDTRLFLRASADMTDTYDTYGTGKAEVFVNGEKQSVVWQMNKTSTGDYGNYITVSSDVTSVTIPAETIFTVEGKQPFMVLNEVSLVKRGGTWYNTDQLPTESSTVAIYSTVHTSSNQIEFYTEKPFGTTLTAWSAAEIMISIDGEEKAVTLNLAPYDSSETKRYFWLQGANITNAIANGSKIEIPSAIEVGFATEIVTFNFAENMTIDKLGQGWGMYTTTYEYPNGNVFYYNIDNGTTYKLTSQTGAIEVKGKETLTVGDELSAVGVYSISRIEDETLFNQIVVLYKHGDANQDGEYNSKDLVAAKLAQAGDAGQKECLAGTYAADIDRSGTVEDIDLLALRRALVSEDAAATLTVSKGNSVLNGVMPIVGFGGPTGDLLTEETYSLIASLGINTVTFAGNDYSNEADEVKKHLQFTEKFGLKLYVNDDHLHQGYEGMTFEEKLADMPSRVGLYSMYESFLGLHIIDEPVTGSYYHKDEKDDTKTKKNISNYADDIALFKNSANLNGYVNLCPYYSSNGTYGATDDSYKAYLQETFVAKEMDVLSYDNYPFRLDKSLTMGNFFTRYEKISNYTDFYKNLEFARTQAQDAGKPFWVYAQAGVYATDIPKSVDTKYLPTASEQQWEISASLAMGAQGVQYYQLVQTEEWIACKDGDMDYNRAGLITLKGKENTTYYGAAKETNTFIAAVDHILMNAESKGVIVNDSTASSNLTDAVKTSYNGLQVGGSNALVGCFDYFGKTVLLVVNCDTSASQTITLRFDAEHELTVTEYDTTTELSGTYSELKMSVGAGQCTLVVVD